MKQIIDGIRYDTERSTLLASDRYHDGHNWERHGRNTYLYKSRGGRFYLLYETCWQGERDRIAPIDPTLARSWYENLPKQEIDYETAFGCAPEEA